MIPQHRYNAMRFTTITTNTVALQCNIIPCNEILCHVTPCTTYLFIGVFSFRSPLPQYLITAMLVGAVKVSTSIGEKAAIVLKGFGVLLGCDGCNVSFFHSVVALDVVAIDMAMAQIISSHSLYIM